MNEEPTVLMNILNIILMIVVYFVVMGGFIFFLCLLNALFKFGHKAGKKFIMFPYF